MLVRWTPRAQSDFDHQIDYIAADNLAAAYRLRDMVLLHIQLLADTPEMGRRGRTLGSRELVISGSPYIAVYRIRNAAIEIVRFLHAAQNYPD